MFQIKKLKSFFNLKTLAVFTLALFLGLISNSIFGRHIFVETFTRVEAEAKLNKRVTDKCFENPEQGTVTSYRREDSGEISVEIKWDKPISGKYDKFYFGKETYQQCVIEIGQGE
jgi:hypothetical protein